MKYKLLIVDDSKLARMVVAKTLSALQPEWNLIEATNADEAVSLAKGERPDIALVDFNMPGRNGFELAAELRDLSPRMRVAVVSANNQKEVIDRAHALGAHFLPKPLTGQVLAEFLNSAVERLKMA